MPPSTSASAYYNTIARPILSESSKCLAYFLLFVVEIVHNKYQPLSIIIVAMVVSLFHLRVSLIQNLFIENSEG